MSYTVASIFPVSCIDECVKPKNICVKRKVFPTCSIALFREKKNEELLYITANFFFFFTMKCSFVVSLKLVCSTVCMCYTV